MSTYCQRCNVFPIEYRFDVEPDKEVEWCRFCWAEWWARGVMEDVPEEFASYYEETLAVIRKEYGDDPGVSDGFDQRSAQHIGTPFG